MKISDNFSITKLFINKQVTLYIDDKTIIINIPTIRKMLEDEKWQQGFYFLTLDLKDFKKILINDFVDQLECIKYLIFTLGAYKQYSSLVEDIKTSLNFIFNTNKIDFISNQKEIQINNVTITSEIWDYVVYILKLSCGEKIEKPHLFNSPEEKAFYLKQQEYERKIKKIKNKDKEGDNEAIVKMILAITYSFPSLTFDYLFDQTLAQIHWLQKMAAGEVSYRVNAQILAAGNMKKGSKLKFFIE